MLNIGEHGLQCPEPDDYAAMALYMQNLGTIIDEQLQEQLDLFNAFFDRPTIIVTNSAIKNIPPVGTVADVYDTVVFNNSAFLSLVIDPGPPIAANYIRVGSAAGAPVTIPYDQGNYTAGACTRMTATGAVDAYTTRSLQVNVLDDSIPFPTNNVLITAIDKTFDTNTGGDEGQIVKTTFEALRTSGIKVNIQASSFNAASSTNILAGGLFYVTYNGPLDIIEVP